LTNEYILAGTIPKGKCKRLMIVQNMLCHGPVRKKNTGRGQLFCGNEGGLTVVLVTG
jgi:hypothetical protein